MSQCGNSEGKWTLLLSRTWPRFRLKVPPWCKVMKRGVKREDPSNALALPGPVCLYNNKRGLSQTLITNHRPYYLLFLPELSLRLLLTCSRTCMVLPFCSRVYSGILLNFRPALSCAIGCKIRGYLGTGRVLHQPRIRRFVYCIHYKEEQCSSDGRCCQP